MAASAGHTLDATFRKQRSITVFSQGEASADICYRTTSGAASKQKEFQLGRLWEQIDDGQGIKRWRTVQQKKGDVSLPSP